MSRRANVFWHYWERFGILAILIVALIVFSILTPNILTAANLLNVLARSAIVGIPALGMTFAICSGGFDLSVGSIVGLSTCVWASALPVVGLVPATLLTLAVGAACGLLNGLAITKLKIVTFVATLSMSMIFRGVALVYTGGSKQMLNRSEHPEAKFFSQSVSVFGQQIQLTQMLMLAAVITAGYFLYRYTRFGVYTRSVGSHEPSSRTSGIRVDRTLILVFVLTGVTAAMSALITASQLMQGAATLGVGFELEVITATILGGTSLAGGRGNIWGSLMAAVMLTLTRNGLNLLGLSDEYQRLAIGVILLLALAISGVQELTKEARK
ncbi:MAG: ABC transporter permease [Oscillospiraceae bacterium]|jgi:ribose/xylose/arabinose/galactoside ABC-type transport system permease subunit|nr:ABC transporter permease [Oscillospiraceae bacterium]